MLLSNMNRIVMRAFSAELVRSKNNFFAEFEVYYATKRAIKITTRLEKKKN